MLEIRQEYMMLDGIKMNVGSKLQNTENYFERPKIIKTSEAEWATPLPSLAVPTKNNPLQRLTTSLCGTLPDTQLVCFSSRWRDFVNGY